MDCFYEEERLDRFYNALYRIMYTVPPAKRSFCTDKDYELTYNLTLCALCTVYCFRRQEKVPFPLLLLVGGVYVLKNKIREEETAKDTLSRSYAMHF